MISMRVVLAVFVSFLCLHADAQEKVIRLYDGPAPGSEDWKQTEQEYFNKSWNVRVVFNVANPTLTVFQPEPGKANGTAVVICPGGGFVALSIDSEGFDVARWLASKGVTCFVLKYRLVECKTNDPATAVANAANLSTGVADGPWKAGLYPANNQPQIAADLVWLKLGSPSPVGNTA
jgi:hypothetical protein